MHHIGFVQKIIMVFRPRTVSSYYYIERQPPMSSCVPDAHNILKVATFCTGSIGLRQQSHHARYWVCRDYFFIDFELFLLIAILNGCPQWAAILLTHLVFSKWQNLAPVKLINVRGPIMYDIGCRDYFFFDFELFLLIAILNGCPQWAAILLTHLMFSKWQNLAPVKLINASGPIMYDIGFVETIFEIFWLWTVSSFSYKKTVVPSEQLFSWRT